MGDDCFWYPAKPDDSVAANPVVVGAAANANSMAKAAVLSEPHPVWSNGTLRYISSNVWSKVKGAMREGCRRHRAHGVQVRTLPANHPLHGEDGLFATKAFEECDIVGEYTGKVVGPEVLCGHYLATLEDKEGEDSLGLDAQYCGNEMRFINSYLNVQFYPNVTMRTAYINSYPHLLIVACRPIEIGDEILLDYGKAYNEMYLSGTKKEEVASELSYEAGRAALPGMADDSSSDDDDDRKGHSN